MAQLQRIATLILIAFFVLQVLAAATPATAEPENKALETPTTSLEKISTAPEQQSTSQAVVQADTKEEKPKEVIADEKPKDENPKEESPKEEKPKEDPKTIEQKPEEQKPTEEKPTEEKPTEEKPAEEKPTEEKSTEEKPAENKSTDIAPAEHQPTTEKPDEQKPTDIAPQQDPSKPSFRKSEHDDTEHEEHHEDHHENHQEEPHEDHEDEHDHQAPYEDYKGEEIDQYLDGELHEHDSSVSEDTTGSKNKTVAAAAAANATAPAVHHAPQAEINGCRTQGQIALTYSEGPSDITAKIVRQLTKADARANFFVNATWLYTQQYAMVVQNIYKAGHFIGMTYRAGEDSLTDDQVRQDVINNARIIEGLIGLSPKYVRLHYTETKDVRTERILQELGFLIVGYNLDSLDYFKKDATGPGSVQKVYEDTFVKYKDTYDAKGSFISIQYDLPYTGSLAAIPHVINTIEQEGYTMVRLDGCLNDPLPYKKTANGTEYVNDKFSFGQSKYHQGQKSVVIETAAEAAAADEEFHMQELDSSASTQQVYSTLLLGLVAAVSALVF